MTSKLRYRTARWVRDICGDWSDMTLWRHLNEYNNGFPKPIRIKNRRYWVEAEILDWLEAQRETS